MPIQIETSETVVDVEKKLEELVSQHSITTDRVVQSGFRVNGIPTMDLLEWKFLWMQKAALLESEGCPEPPPLFYFSTGFYSAVHTRDTVSTYEEVAA